MLTRQKEHSFILVVDDHEDFRDAVTMLLQASGYPVVGVTNGREALDYLQDHPDPCLILLDLTMPVMNGWEFREKQRQNPVLASVPVVVVSGTEYDRGNPDLDAVQYFEKPVDVESLIQTVGALC